MRYSEFNDIEVPQFLSGPEWSDNSWRNDVYPKSELDLDLNGRGHVLRVWVAPVERSEREYPDCARLMVEHDEMGESCGGRMIHSGESEEHAAIVISGFCAMFAEVQARTQETTDLEFMQTVVEVLNLCDQDATLEYPGFVSVQMDGHMSLAIGNNNECWTADVVDHDGYPIPDAGFEADHLKNNTRDAEAVVAWILHTRSEAEKAAA